MKKKWVFPVSIIGGVLLLGLVVIGAFLLWHCSGIYVRTSGGRHMVVFDDSGPMILSTTDKPDRFDGIETGDRVIAVCGFVHDTYPAQSDAKFVLRLWKGDLEDIPQKDRDALWELGRLFENKDSATEEDADFPDWGLTLSVKDVTPTGLTLVCTQEGGNPTGDLQCGEDYRLIALEDGVWKDVPTVLGNFIWDSLAYPIPKRQDRAFEISWEWLYGELPAGYYRLVKEFMDFRGTADFDTAKYWVEFEITE
ncbi:MAG: hypothetical protein E7268_07425 [Lachnospiraceae bacterium]|nr:hypothetical protein [Lachnospiraceae bacterium]